MACNDFMKRAFAVTASACHPTPQNIPPSSWQPASLLGARLRFILNLGIATNNSARRLDCSELSQASRRFTIRAGPASNFKLAFRLRRGAKLSRHAPLDSAKRGDYPLREIPRVSISAHARSGVNPRANLSERKLHSRRRFRL